MRPVHPLPAHLLEHPQQVQARVGARTILEARAVTKRDGGGDCRLLPPGSRCLSEVTFHAPNMDEDESCITGRNAEKDFRTS